MAFDIWYDFPCTIYLHDILLSGRDRKYNILCNICHHNVICT